MKKARQALFAFFSAHQSVKGRAPQPGFGLAHVKDRDVSQQALLGEAVVELFGKGGVGERGHAQGHAAGDVQAAKGQGGENVIAAGPAVEAGEPFQGLGKCQGVSLLVPLSLFQASHLARPTMSLKLGFFSSLSPLVACL